MRLRLPSSLPDEAVAAGSAASRPDARATARLSRRNQLGGTEGNEILTSATAVVLTVLLLAEGVTIVRMRGLVSAHMFIGMVLIPPVLLKLASTGYRFVRYYTGSRAYRAKGPPLLPLRLLAPALVVTTVAVFVTGVLLLAGYRTGARHAARACRARASGPCSSAPRSGPAWSLLSPCSR